jgi:hypothetical protein
MNFPSPTEEGKLEDLPPYAGEGPSPSVYVPPAHDLKVDVFSQTAVVHTGLLPGRTLTATAHAGPSVLPPPPPPPLVGPSDSRTVVDVSTTANDLPTLNGFYQPEKSNYRGPPIQVSVQPPFRIASDYVSPEQSQLAIALEGNSLGQFNPHLPSCTLKYV